MNMVLKNEVFQAQRNSGQDKPICLAHLSRQTQCDAALEAEILSMFASQSTLQVDLIFAAKTERSRKLAAHTLKGGANAVGAFQLAELACEIETGNINFEKLRQEHLKVLSYIRGLQT